MSKKKGVLPELLFVHPVGNNQHKIRHKHVVFLITEWDEKGLPKTLRRCDDNEVFDVERVQNSGAEFMTGYIQEQMLDPRPERANRKATY